MLTGAIGLAACESKRVGRNTPLLCLNNKTLIENILNATVAAHVDETVVVLGYEPQGLPLHDSCC
jgi:CTP:molybdopterin cytidylyltransferase MocA